MRGLSIIIPSRNVANLLPCLRALRACDPHLRAIVVDDGIDRSAIDVGERFVDVLEVIEGEKPFVFARNVNHGIQVAGNDDVVILNDDALLQTHGGFSLLQQTAEQHPEFGVISAACNNVRNRNQWPQNIGPREDPRMVCFVAVLIPRRTIEAVGLLDQQFVGYGCDDDDYCLRVRRPGPNGQLSLKIGIHDGCYVDHGSLTSTYRGVPTASGDYQKNMSLFINKWGVDLQGNPAQ